MKTIISILEKPVEPHERQDGIFYHPKDVSISWQIRPLPKTTNMYHYRDGIKERITELNVMVIRFPKHLKPEASSELYYALRTVFYFQWVEAGDDVELLLHEGLAVRVFWALAKEGIFRFSIKEYPNVKEARYFPVYQNSVKLWQKAVNVITITSCIPHLIVLTAIEEMEKKKKKKERLLEIEKESVETS